MSLLRTWKFITHHPLGRSHRRASLSRWVRWQVGSRLLQCPVEYPFVNNSRLVVERSMQGATGNVYVGLHEFVEMSFVLHLLRPGDLLLDLGANVGVYTVLASAVCGARSLACEPAPTTYQRLVRNIRANAVEALADARQVAVGSEETVLRFTIDRDATNQVAPPNYAGQCVDVAATTVDRLLESVAPPAGETMWKVDLEGYEPAMLAGARETLASAPPAAILIEADTQDVRETLEAHGYRTTGYDPAGRRLIATSAPLLQKNQIWVHKSREEFVNRRIASSPSFHVHGMSV
ncbi:MAG: FkbM family methyltransferase [Pirellulales bacterium]|nr:FkbM family methyltransferase [Pirellulales bacterium]